METSRHDRIAAPRELPIVGGHVALDFANTVDDPGGPAHHDHAATYPDLLSWATRVDLVDDKQTRKLLRAAADHPQHEVAAIRRAHTLRNALNDLFSAVADGRPDLSAPWSRLRPFVSAAYNSASIGPTDGSDRPGRNSPRQQWIWPQNELDIVLHPIATAAAGLLVGPDLPRIKRCARCPWMFLDRSRNHSRRWCDMDDCGRAQKVERYVARRRSSRGSSTEQPTR